MATLDEAVIARYVKGGEHFEVLVDPDRALRIRAEHDSDIEGALVVEEIFKHASRGDKASEEGIKKVFGTTDTIKVAEKIIKEGEIHLTSEQRRRIQEDKRKQVVNVIARNAVNPQTGAPHPPARIEKAMEEAKMSIDPFKNVDELVGLVMKAIRPVIPIRFEEIDIAVKIPADYTAKSYGELQNFGSIIKEGWQKDGAGIGVVRFPAGLQNDFYELVNRLTKGEAETRKVKRDGIK
jgi:ribosome maturation protein SDO1